MANCPQCGTYFVEGNGYFGCCCKNCYEELKVDKPWHRDAAEAGIDLAFKGIEAGFGFLFGKKSKSSASKSGSSSRMSNGMTVEEDRTHRLSPEEEREIELLEMKYDALNKVEGRIDSNFIGKKPGKIIRATVCIPVSIIFFFLIFIFQRIGIVWGSIIAVAIMAEAMAITGPSDDWGNRISQIIFLPVLGGIGGIIVGGVAWILSSFWTFVMVTWAIVMIGASLLLIFMDDLDKL